jgi:hypothetical protein
MFGLVDAISSPAYATSVGLLKYGVAQIDESASANGTGPFSNALSAVGNWLRSFFP